MRVIAAAALALGFTAGALVLTAAPALAGTKEQAAEAYQEGAKAFKGKDFETALGHFDRAFKLDPSPILLYNIARCHEEMGALDPAISNFQLYLVRAPDAADREDVERRIRVMEAIKKRQAELEPAEGSPGDSALPVWGYSLLGAGVAAFAVGGGFGYVADTAAEEHRAAVTRAKKSSTKQDADTNSTYANASFVIGGVLALAGASILAWDLLSDHETSVEVAPVPTASGGGVSIRATF